MPIEPYVYPFRLRLHETDAAGVLFYAHLFRLAHDAYEAFMADIGFPLHGLISGIGPGAGLRLPIVRAESEYHHPLRHGDQVRIELRVSEVRRRSFALDFRFRDEAGQVAAVARTVHVLVATGQGDTSALPDDLRRALTGESAGGPTFA